MAIDITAGVDQPQIDLSAGLSSPSAKVDLSAGLQSSPSRVDLSAGVSEPAPSGPGYPTPTVPGNIQWFNRQRVPDPSRPGYFGTVFSASRSEDGYEVLYPRVYDGAFHSDADAWQRYKQTGEHMGKWKIDARNPNAAYKAADAYGQKYHEDAAAGRYETPAAVPTGSVSGYTPSLWDRISRVFTEGVPSLSSRTVYNPKYGQTQLLSPEEALTPDEQERHPVITGAGEFAGGLTSPESVATIAATGGLGELPGAAAVIPRLISAGFGANAIYSAIKQTPEVRDAFQRGDTATAERLLTKAVLNVGAAALAARHAATGEGAATGKAKPTPIAEDVPVHPSSPISEVIRDTNAPDVRVVDSSATKAHLEGEDTEPLTSASLRGPSDIAPLRVARVVNDDHTPVVARSAVLSQAIQTALDNSGELQKIGIDPAQIKSPADAEAMLQQAAEHIRTNLDPRASSTLTFDVQRQLAEELGMSVEDLLSRKSGTAFNAEQAIAARSLLDASGKNVVRVATESTDNTALADALAQHQAVLDAVKGVSAEAGRALGSFKAQTIEAQISNALRDLSGDALDEARTLLKKIDTSNPRQLNQWLEQVKPSTSADKIFELYRNSLLSGPATVIKKAVSETTMLALETTKKAVAAGLAKVEGSNEQRYASESYWFAKGAIDALQHAKSVLTGEFDLADMPDFERTGQQAIKGRIGDIVRIPSTILSRQTNLMYTLNYFGELNARAARQALSEGLKGPELAARQAYLVEHPSVTMTQSANSLALKNTFQSELGKTAKNIQSAIRSEPTGLAKYLLPFFKTPINLAKATADYSPYGFFKGIAKGDIDAQARGLVGSSLAAGIAYLSLSGHITGGGPIDFAKQQTKAATGWQPYSIKLGDRYVSYRRLEPLGLAFALVADAVHGAHAGDDEVVAQSKADTAVAHIVRSLQDVAFIPTLSNLAEALTNPGAHAQRFIQNEAASIVPALVKDIAQATDRTIRRPQGIAQAIEARIPGLTQQVPAAIDISGQPVQRPASSIGGINPFPVSTTKNDPTLNELSRLGISTPNPPASIKLRGKATPLSQSERQQIAQQEGEQFYQRATRLISSPSWTRKTDDAKRAAITDIRRDIDEGRAARVAKIRKTAQAELARASL